MATYSLAPWFVQQFFDNDGLVLAFGKVHSYVTGSSTPLDTYSTASGTPNTNPIILDAAGRCRIYLQPTSYKFVTVDANDVPVGLDMDPVTATNAGSSGLGEIFVFGSNSSSPITVTSYPSGATFDKLQPGSSVFEADSANLTGTYIVRATGVMEAAGTLSAAIVNLTDGAPDTPIAVATMTSTTGEVADSGSITFGAPGTTKQYGIKTKVSANTGELIGISLVRTA